VSSVGLFAVGAAVTMLVAAALALLIYAAIEDGRAERDARARADAEELAARRPAAKRPSPSAA